MEDYIKYHDIIKEQAQKDALKDSFKVVYNQNISSIGEEMKNITKRADGRYMAHYQLNKTRIYAYGRTQKQAIEELKKLKKKVLTYEKVKSNYTFAEWNKYWLETYKRPFVKDKTFRDTETLIKEINKSLGHFKLNNLKPNIIQEFYNKYSRSRKKEKILIYIKASLQKAFESGNIKINPANAIVKEEKLVFNEQPYTIDEQEKILNAVKGTDIECYVWLYLLTGIRKNELDNNVMNCINFETNQFKALNEKQKINKSQYKYIDLNPKFIDWIVQRKNKFTLNANQVYNRFKIILNKLGIEGHLHKLRHTFATNYYYLGVPLKTIQEWCGHSTPNITEQIYVGVSRENIKERLIKLYNNLLYEF